MSLPLRKGLALPGLAGHPGAGRTAGVGMEEFSTALTGPVLPVVGLCLVAADGRVCMQQRPAGKAHGGRWEFPGGKVEAGETHRSALAREIAEELGIAVRPQDLVPIAFADRGTLEDSRPDGGGAVLIVLYAATSWEGEVQALEGGAVGWFEPDSLADLPMPPLDVPLVRQVLRLLRHGGI